MKDNYLSMDADQELPDDQLPPGLTPIWIQPPDGATQVEMLERVKEVMRVIGHETDVMVLYFGSDEVARAWCRKEGWQYHNAWNIFGCEARCVVLLDCVLDPEYITRGIKKLIICGR